MRQNESMYESIKRSRQLQEMASKAVLIDKYILTIPSNDPSRKEIQTYLLSGKPVDLVYTDESGDWMYAVVPSDEKNQGLWLNGFKTEKEAIAWVSSIGLKVNNLYDPYKKLQK